MPLSENQLLNLHAQAEIALARFHYDQAAIEAERLTLNPSNAERVLWDLDDQGAQSKLHTLESLVKYYESEMLSCYGVRIGSINLQED